MVQAYYQADLFAATFLQPTVTYIPTPGLAPNLPGALATTLRLTVLFWSVSFPDTSCSPSA
jgi:porin